mmetsp:Transcript_18309/g.64852  ORF Transcript_18309/g.64852 Transcript_18309/m.64852 type:complete len:221 (-) Transcript_18309:103-765(-)
MKATTGPVGRKMDSGCPPTMANTMPMTACASIVSVMPMPSLVTCCNSPPKAIVGANVAKYMYTTGAKMDVVKPSRQSCTQCGAMRRFQSATMPPAKRFVYCRPPTSWSVTDLLESTDTMLPSLSSRCRGERTPVLSTERLRLWRPSPPSGAGIGPTAGDMKSAVPKSNRNSCAFFCRAALDTYPWSLMRRVFPRRTRTRRSSKASRTSRSSVATWKMWRN